ncbi:MAG: MYG1 family protein [Minisyncoccia bacterium]
MNTIVTHDAKFHTDDVFSVATLFLLLGKENCTVIRTRNEEIIKTADYVVDVGNEYIEDKNRFDHHQIGGAGERENGIPYASFGLVWKKYGNKICVNEVVSDEIDKILVQQVDAGDNGVNLFTLTEKKVFPVILNSLVDLFRSTWNEVEDWDNIFLRCVDWATAILVRQIKVTTDWLEGEMIIKNAYEKSEDKEMIIFDKKYNLGRELVTSALMKYPEPIYGVYYRADSNKWQIAAIRKERGEFDTRKPFPEEWRGMRDDELAKVTGIHDAVFCHRGGFMCVVSTKEGAIALAQKALLG